MCGLRQCSDTGVKPCPLRQHKSALISAGLAGDLVRFFLRLISFAAHQRMLASTQFRRCLRFGGFARWIVRCVIVKVATCPLFLSNPKPQTHLLIIFARNGLRPLYGPLCPKGETGELYVGAHGLVCVCVCVYVCMYVCMYVGR